MKAVVLASFVLFASSAQAVTIQDSLWRQEGGTKSKPWAGFGASIKLANEPQFKSVLALSTDGENWGEASGTWIGNDEDHAYILTSAHIYEKKPKASDYVIRGTNGKTLKADKIWVHPDWNGDTESRTGYDLVILRLPFPLNNAGPQPILYDGKDELKKLITFVGYGSRGIGSTGEDDKYYEASDKAAAQGLVEEVVDATPELNETDSGSYLGIWMGREDGSLKNPFGGSNKPATPFVGLVGSGDSGGSAWMKRGEQWMIVGVNSNGSGKASYGDKSWFTRVSFQKPWILKIFPRAKFSGS